MVTWELLHLLVAFDFLVAQRQGIKKSQDFLKRDPDALSQYLWTFLIDIQTEVSKVSLFCLFSQNLARLQSFLSFISYNLVIILHLELFEDNLFEFVSIH